MRRTLVILLVLVFMLSGVKPVFAESQNDSTSIVTIGVVVGVLVVLGVIIGINHNDESRTKKIEKQKEEEQEAEDQKNMAFTESMVEAIGKLTYDEALDTWGAPARVVKGDKRFYAVWENTQTVYVSSSQTKSTGYTKRKQYDGVAGAIEDAVMPNENGYSQSSSVAAAVTKGEVLTLTFNVKTRKLVEWKKEVK